MGSGPNWHEDYATAPPFIVNEIGNFSAFEMKVQAVNEKGQGPEPDPVIGYSGEDGKIKKWLTQFFFKPEIYLLCILSHVTLSSDIPSSTGGSNERRNSTNKQHYHQSKVGSSKKGDSQGTPARIQGTEYVVDGLMSS